MSGITYPPEMLPTSEGGEVYLCPAHEGYTKCERCKPMTSDGEIKRVIHYIDDGYYWNEQAAALILRLRDERDEALKTIILRECEIDTLDELIGEARNKALDEAAKVLNQYVAEMKAVDAEDHEDGIRRDALEHVLGHRAEAILALKEPKP